MPGITLLSRVPPDTRKAGTSIKGVGQTARDLPEMGGALLLALHHSTLSQQVTVRLTICLYGASQVLVAKIIKIQRRPHPIQSFHKVT